jgi:hypothetical protein
VDDALSWGPPRGAAVALVVLGLAAAGLALTQDPLGRLLLAVAAVLFAAAGGWVLRGPSLSADPDGVRVRGVLRTHELPWDAVATVLVDDRRRSRAVELETEDGLLAVPALLLGGVSPRVVAQQLTVLQQSAAR